MLEDYKLKVVQQCRDLGFGFKVIQKSEETVLDNGKVKIEGSAFIYFKGEREIAVKADKISNIYVLPAEKIAVVILRQKFLLLTILASLVPALIGVVISVLGEFFGLAGLISTELAQLIIAFGLGAFIFGYIGSFATAVGEAKRQELIYRNAVGSSGNLIRELDQVEGENEYFTKLIQINLKNIEAYYTLIKSQTKNSFLLVASSITVGFLVIITGVAVGIFFKGNELASSLTIGSGVVANFISAVLFYLYNRTAKQLNLYHDKLVHVQNTMLSLKVAQLISSKKKKNETLEYLTRALTAQLGEDSKTSKHLTMPST